MRRLKCSLMIVVTIGSLAMTACGDDENGSSESTTSAEGATVSFCEAAASYMVANGSPNPATSTPADLEATFTRLRDVLDQLRSVAPSEIADDVDTVATVFEDYISAFAAQDFDYSKLMDDPSGQAATEALNSDDMGAAMGNIDDYIAVECDIVTTTAPEDGTGSTPGLPIPDSAAIDAVTEDLTAPAAANLTAKCNAFAAAFLANSVGGGNEAAVMDALNDLADVVREIDPAVADALADRPGAAGAWCKAKGMTNT